MSTAGGQVLYQLTQAPGRARGSRFMQGLVATLDKINCQHNEALMPMDCLLGTPGSHAMVRSISSRQNSNG